jgi:polysaccharide export outer membrane protein
MSIFSTVKKLKNIAAVLVAALVSLSIGVSHAQSSSQYILEAGDRIFVQVFDEPDLTMEATVAQSGTINYSYLGSIQVAGRTPEQLTQILTEKLRDGYLRNPSVNVTVRQYRSFFVDGEVKSPGSYAYEPGLTVAKAVTLGGGLTDRASRRKIFLTREVEGEKRSYRVDMSQTIEPGDVITIREGFF